MDGVPFWLPQSIEVFVDIIVLPMTYKIIFDIYAHGDAMSLENIVSRKCKCMKRYM